MRQVFGLSEIDREIDRGKVLTPKIYRTIYRGKVFTPKMDREIDQNKVLGTKVRFLEKSRNTDQNKKEEEKRRRKKYTLKMKPLGKYLTFRNRP